MVRATGIDLVTQVLSSAVTIQGTAVAEDSLILMKTSTFNLTPANRKGLIVVHGAGEEYDIVIDDAKVQTVFRGLLDTDVPWVIYSINAGGPQTWGNDTAIARVDSAVAVLKVQYGISATEIYGLGLSAGYLAISNSWKATNANFIRTVGILPIISLSTIEANDIESAESLIDTAYSTYVAATEENDHDPDHYFNTESDVFGGSNAKTLLMFAPADQWQITPGAYSGLNRYTVSSAATTDVESYDLGSAHTHSYAAIQSVTAAQINGWLISGTVPT